MKKSFQIFGVTAASVFMLSLAAHGQNTTSYAGNGGGGFGGPIGAGMLTFSTDGTTLTGTITIGGNHAYNDELVIYIDDKTGGFTNTASLTDTGSPAGTDTLRGATSGLSNGNANMGTPVRAPLTFASGFGADYAIALSPNRAVFGSFYTLNSTSNFTYGSDGNNGNANLTPTGTNNGNGTEMYTFSVPLTLLGSPSSFKFQTTYLNGDDAYRSNEAFGNTIVDTTNPSNTDPTTGNLAQDAGTLVGINTFLVPEPSTWMTAVVGGMLLGGFRMARARRQQVVRTN